MDADLPPITKRHRLTEFVRRVLVARPCCTHDEAFRLIEVTLTQVEDEFTSIPNNPGAWREDDRMYPPHPDFERQSSLPGVRRYRSVRHNTEIGCNGAIRILEIDAAEPLLDKAGLDGRKISEL